MFKVLLSASLVFSVCQMYVASSVSKVSQITWYLLSPAKRNRNENGFKTNLNFKIPDSCLEDRYFN